MAELVEKTAVMEMLEPEMAELLSEFLDKIKGKSMAQMMPVLAEYKARLPSDRTFSPMEKNAILEEALGGMAEEERNRFKTFLKMAKIV